MTLITSQLMTLRRFQWFLLAICLTILCSSTRAQQPPLDTLIINGRIIDGTGSPWYSGDVGIRDGRIAAIGYLRDTTNKQTIDAHGKVVAPGFIDMLGQS